MVKYFFCDLETSDTDPYSNSIISYSFGVTDENYNQLNELDIFANPVGIWDFEAQEVHKITQQQCKTFEHEITVWEKVLDWLHENKGTKNYFIYQAREKGWYDAKSGKTNWGRFDWAFIEAMSWKYLNLFKLRQVFTSDDDIKSLTPLLRADKRLQKASLADACKLHNIELDHHNAKSDRMALQKLWVIYNTEKPIKRSEFALQ